MQKILTSARAGARTKRDDVDTPDHRRVRTDRGVRARRIPTHRDVGRVGVGVVKGGGRGRRERRRRVRSSGSDDDDAPDDDDERRRVDDDVDDGDAARRVDAEGV